MTGVQVTHDQMDTQTLHSWRLWWHPGTGGPPELVTIQVRETRGPGAPTSWSVWAWYGWTGYWDEFVPRARWMWGRVHLDPEYTLQTATRRARALAVLLAGRRWDGADVVSMDAGALSGAEAARWTLYPVDPPPPWAQLFPGPQDWRGQLTRGPGERGPP